jgi:hypothetical protein
MIKHLSRIVASLLLVLCLVSVAPAQPQTSADPGVSLTTPASAPEKTGPNSTPSMALVFVSTVLVLFIICKPTRKI